MKGKDLKGEKGEFMRKYSSGEKFSGLVFRVATDPYIGTLTFFRIYSGKVKAGAVTEFWCTHKKQSGGTGRCAEVQSVLEPNIALVSWRAHCKPVVLEPVRNWR